MAAEQRKIQLVLDVVAATGGGAGGGSGGGGANAAGIGGLLGALVGGPAGAVIGSLAAGSISSAFRSVTGAGMSGAALANPVAFQMMGDAIKDTSAVIGRVFVPVLETVTKVVRLFGDFLASVLPTTGEMRAIFSALDPAFKAIRDTLKDLAPVVKSLIQLLVEGFAEALKFVAGVIRDVLQFLGVTGTGPELASSFGASGRPARIMGVEEYGRSAALAALSGPSLQQKMADDIKVIRESVQSAQRQMETDAINAPGDIALDAHRR